MQFPTLIAFLLCLLAVGCCALLGKPGGTGSTKAKTSASAKAKPVPHFMQASTASTKAKVVAKAKEAVAKPASPPKRAAKELDENNLPNFMKTTASSKGKMVQRQAEDKAAEAEKSRKPKVLRKIDPNSALLRAIHHQNCRLEGQRTRFSKCTRLTDPKIGEAELHEDKRLFTCSSKLVALHEKDCKPIKYQRKRHYVQVEKTVKRRGKTVRETADELVLPEKVWCCTPEEDRIPEVGSSDEGYGSGGDGTHNDGVDVKMESHGRRQATTGRRSPIDEGRSGDRGKGEDLVREQHRPRQQGNGDRKWSVWNPLRGITNGVKRVASTIGANGAKMGALGIGTLMAGAALAGGAVAPPKQQVEFNKGAMSSAGSGGSTALAVPSGGETGGPTASTAVALPSVSSQQVVAAVPVDHTRGRVSVGYGNAAMPSAQALAYMGGAREYTKAAQMLERQTGQQESTYFDNVIQNLEQENGGGGIGNAISAGSARAVESDGGGSADTLLSADNVDVAREAEGAKGTQTGADADDGGSDWDADVGTVRRAFSQEVSHNSGRPMGRPRALTTAGLDQRSLLDD